MVMKSSLLHSTSQAQLQNEHRDDNEVRPHSAIGNNPPVTLIERSALSADFVGCCMLGTKPQKNAQC